MWEEMAGRQSVKQNKVNNERMVLCQISNSHDKKLDFFEVLCNDFSYVSKREELKESWKKGVSFSYTF